MPKNYLWIGLAVLIVLIGGLLWWNNSQSATPLENNLPQASSSVESTMPGVAVTMSSSGFSPQDVTVSPGQQITWVNKDADPHQVASDPHPTHTSYPPLNTIGLLNSGDKKSLSFPDPGVYKYHDHLNPSFKGSVTVK